MLHKKDAKRRVRETGLEINLDKMEYPETNSNLMQNFKIGGDIEIRRTGNFKYFDWYRKINKNIKRRIYNIKDKLWTGNGVGLWDLLRKGLKK